MQTRHRRSHITLAFALLATAVFGAIPSGSAEAATTVVYNGAGSAPRISIIGDSTIAALRWTNQFEPLKRFNFVYDAESCRRTVLPSCRGREGYTPDNVISAMRRLSGRLGSVLVIMGGYDDPSSGFAGAVDTVMAEAARQGIPTVLWLSLRSNVPYVGPGSISNAATFRANNHTLYRKAIQYGPRLQVADWATYSANHPEWFYSDGIHFTPAGANAGATFIANQAGRVLDGHIVTPPAGQARPAAPRSLTAAVGNGVGSGSVRLTWSTPSATGGVPISDYVIQRSDNGGLTWISLHDPVTTGRVFTARRLTDGSTYRFRVAARNAVGWGPASAVVAATPRPSIPTAPRSLATSVGNGVGSGNVRLTWASPLSGGGVPITDYVIQRSDNGGATWISLHDTVSTSRTFTATRLTDGSTYRFRVAARNAAGWGPASNIVTATPRPSVPSAPRSLTAATGSGVGSGQVQLTWTAPASTGGIPITDYVIQRSDNGGTTWISLHDPVSTSRTFTATGLTDGSTYRFRVAARNAAGWGPVSNIVTATPGDSLAAAAVSEPTTTTTSTTTSTTTTTTTTPTSSTTTAPSTSAAAPTTTASPSTTSTSTSVVVEPPSSQPPTASTIGDLVWLDTDGDGVQAPEEAGVEGVVVVLLDEAGVEIARDVTDHRGEYVFADLAPGPFMLELELPTGYGIAPPNQGHDVELDSDLVTVDEQRGTARTRVLVVPAEHLDGFDLGLVALPAEPDGATAADDGIEGGATSSAPTTAAPVTQPPTTVPATTVSTTAAPTTAVPTTTIAPTSSPPSTTSPPTTATPTTAAVGD